MDADHLPGWLSGAGHTIAGGVRQVRIVLYSLLAVGLATLLSQTIWFQHLGNGLADAMFDPQDIAASQRVILVLVDEESVQASGKFPYDRMAMASAVRLIGDAGAKRVFLDTGLTSPNDEASDTALEEVMSSLGPQRLAIITGRLFPGSKAPWSKPIERFNAKATQVSFDAIRDVDRRVRRINTISPGGVATAGEWLATGATTPSPKENLFIDFSADPRRIERVTITQLLSPGFDTSIFKDRLVILGMSVSADGYTLPVPLYGWISRPEIVALTTIAALSEIKIEPIDSRVMLAITAALTAIMAVIMAPINFAAGLIVLIVFGIGWFQVVLRIHGETGILVPYLPPLLASLIAWQTLSFQHSPIMKFMRRAQARLLGVGQAALLTAIDVIVDPAIVFDKSGNVLGANGAFLRLRVDGASRSGSISRIEEVLGEESARLVEALADENAGTSSRTLDICVSSASQSARHYHVTVGRVRSPKGLLGIASFRDITEARARESELTTLAFRDALTGLANRVAFQSRLSTLETSPAQDPFAILLIDLDGFKKVNDTLGHHAGDLVLRGVADRIRALLRPDDMAARLGGDEFVVICKGADEARPVAVARAIVDELTRVFDIEGVPAHIGGSVGIAMWPHDDDRSSAVLKKADIAMYAAKQQKPAIARHGSDGPVILSRAA